MSTAANPTQNFEDYPAIEFAGKTKAVLMQEVAGIQKILLAQKYKFEKVKLVEERVYAIIPLKEFVRALENTKEDAVPAITLIKRKKKQFPVYKGKKSKHQKKMEKRAAQEKHLAQWADPTNINHKHYKPKA